MSTQAFYYKFENDREDDICSCARQDDNIAVIIARRDEIYSFGEIFPKATKKKSGLACKRFDLTYEYPLLCVFYVIVKVTNRRTSINTYTAPVGRGLLQCQKLKKCLRRIIYS